MDEHFAETVNTLAKKTYNGVRNVNSDGDNYLIRPLTSDISYIKPGRFLGGLLYRHKNDQVTFVTTYKYSETVGRHVPKERVRENEYVEVCFYHVFVPDSATLDKELLVEVAEQIEYDQPDDSGNYSGYRVRKLEDALEDYYTNEIKPYNYFTDSPVKGHHAGYSTHDDGKEAVVGGNDDWEADHEDWPSGWVPAVVESDTLGHQGDQEFYHRGRAYQSGFQDDPHIDEKLSERESMLNNR